MTKRSGFLVCRDSVVRSYGGSATGEEASFCRGTETMTPDSEKRVVFCVTALRTNMRSVSRSETYCERYKTRHRILTETGEPNDFFFWLWGDNTVLEVLMSVAALGDD